MDSPGTQPSAGISRRQRWMELGLVILFAIVPATLLAAGSLLYPRTGAPAGTHFGLAYGLVQQISILLLVFYLLSRRGAGLGTLGLHSYHWTDLLTGLGLAVAAMVLSACLHLLVLTASPSVTGRPADIRDPRVIFAGISTASMVIYSISSSIFEETVVRGFVTSELIALSFPVWLATMISVVLQTSYHVYYGMAGAVGISGIFIAFGIYFANSRRLLPVILGHMFVDLTAVAMQHWR